MRDRRWRLLSLSRVLLTPTYMHAPKLAGVPPYLWRQYVTQLTRATAARLTKPRSADRMRLEMALAATLGIEPPLHRRRVDFFTKTRSFDWSKARTELGYCPRGSIDDEAAAIIASYRELGWLD